MVERLVKKGIKTAYCHSVTKSWPSCLIFGAKEELTKGLMRWAIKKFLKAKHLRNWLHIVTGDKVHPPTLIIKVKGVPWSYGIPTSLVDEDKR